MNGDAHIDDLVASLSGYMQRFTPGAGAIDAEERSSLRALIDRVESSTPGGAPLHSQLDNVRKWLDALDRPEDHERFGGVDHLHAYVLTQLRLALGALEDYQRAM